MKAGGEERALMPWNLAKFLRLRGHTHTHPLMSRDFDDLTNYLHLQLPKYSSPDYLMGIRDSTQQLPRIARFISSNVSPLAHQGT
jgi:hypothetical protein